MREEIESWLNQSILNSLPRRCAHQAGWKTRVPDSDEVFLEKPFCRDFCLNGRHRIVQRGAVTSTRSPALSQAKHSPVLVKNTSSTTPRCSPSPSRPRSRDTARGSPLCSRDDLLLLLSFTLPDVRLNCHSDTVLLDSVLLLRCVERRMVRVGGIRVLQLCEEYLYDFAETCVNFHHFDTQSRRGDIIWLPS